MLTHLAAFWAKQKKNKKDKKDKRVGAPIKKCTPPDTSKLGAAPPLIFQVATARSQAHTQARLGLEPWPVIQPLAVGVLADLPSQADRLALWGSGLLIRCGGAVRR